MMRRLLAAWLALAPAAAHAEILREAPAIGSVQSVFGSTSTIPTGTPGAIPYYQTSTLLGASGALAPGQLVVGGSPPSTGAVTQIAAPGAPASGNLALWGDSTSTAVLSTKNNSGVTSNTVQPIASVSHQFLTAISANGVVSQAQPAFGDISGSVPCAQMPALTGDVTTSAGSCADTVVNITTGATVAGTMIHTQIAAPSSPAASKLTVWADSTATNVLSTKNNGGTISNTVVPSSAGANQFATGISSAGAVSYAQPAFSNLSGSATCAQLPALTGDVTTSAGSCADTVVNLTTGVTVAGTMIHTQIAAPGSPAASKLTVWADSTNTNVLSAKNNGGTVSNTVVPSTAGSHQFATAVSGNGAVTYAQPAFSDISGTATNGQLANSSITISGASISLGGTYAPARVSATPANPTGTSNTSVFVMAGLAVAVTPATSGKLLLMAIGNAANNVSNDGCAVKIQYGTGTAPTNGAALTGTTAGNQVTPVVQAANIGSPFAVYAIASGLTVSTAYWVDLAQFASVGGTCSLVNIAFSIVEL